MSASEAAQKTKKNVLFQYLTIHIKKIVAIALITGMYLVGGCETAPPVQEMSDARQAIAVAREAGAADHGSMHLNAAVKYLADAESNLSRRAYNQARRDAKQAKIKALDALKAAEDANKAE